MPRQGAGWTDAQVEVVLGNLLRVGVIVAAGVVLLGAVPYLVRYGGERVDRSTFEGEPAELCSPVGIVTGALLGHRRALIQLGLLLLIATPVARVAFTVLAFARERDWTYVALTLVVLVVLLYSMFWGASAA